MRFPRLLYTVLGAIFLSTIPLQANQSLPTAVTIQVNDPSGSPIPHATVRIVPAPDTSPSKMETNAKGEFTLPLKPGGYGLFVEAQGFKSYVNHLEVKGGVSVQAFPLILQLGATGSPQVMPASAEKTLELLAFPYHEPLFMPQADLKTFPHITVTVKNSHNDTQETYSGVRLSDLFIKLGAPLGKELRGRSMLSYIKASGSDGYSVVFSLAELDPDFHPGDIIVADQMNGLPFDSKSGPFKLVASEDKRPARWVRNLVTLELKSAE